MKKEDLRPVAVSSHQVHWVGYFHTYIILEENGERKNYALIEDQRGKLGRIDLSYHSLKFLDRNEI